MHRRAGALAAILLLILALLPVAEAAAPTAGFTYAPLAPTTSDAIAFTDTSTDDWNNITNWTWDFGDGTFAYVQNPTHQYADDGAYTVILNVTDNETFWDTYSTTITVSNVAPTSAYTFAPAAPLTGDTVSFTDTSTDSDGTVVNWTWDLGDGNSSYAQHPTHNYPDDGTYTVNLTVRDDDGATHTSSQSVTVTNRAPSAAFTSSGLYGDTRTTFTFSDASTDADGSVVNQTWTLGDGTTLYGTPVSHQYALNETYAVTLTVRDDDGATSSANASVTVNLTGVGGGAIDYAPPPQIATYLQENALLPGHFFLHLPIGPDTHSIRIAAHEDSHGLRAIDLEVSGAGSIDLELSPAETPDVPGYAIGPAFDISLTLGGETQVLSRLLRLDPEAYPSGADPDHVVLLHGDDGAWHAVATHGGQAAPTSFSPFAIAVDTEDPVVTAGPDATFEATDNRGIAQVILYIDGQQVDVAQEGDTYRAASESGPGRHEARAVVTDDSGRVTEKRWSFDAATPGTPSSPSTVPSMESPANGESKATGQHADAPAPGLALVLVALGGLVLTLRRRTA